MPGFLKCTCEHCGGRIEYPAEAVGANVACPHCQQDTPLKLDSDDGADVVVVGGGKAKLVMGVVVASLIAVAALAATLVWVKRKAPQKHASGTTQQPPAKVEKAVAVAPASPAARVELDPPKAVTPVIYKFQGGLTGAQIKHGRELFGGACTECHRQYDPATYNETEWERTIGGMRGKAKLKGRESSDLDTFVRTVRN